MAKYTTITDIAKELGISHSTVSRALSDHPRISEETRKKVKDLAKSLGYQSNKTANHLSSGKSQIIGVIVPDLLIHFYARVIQGIQTALNEEDYSIMLFNTQESFEKEVKAIDDCLKYRVDGVLAAISMKTKTFDHFEKLLKHEVPLVFFDRVANFLPVPKVVTNDHQAAFKATNHLIQSGCRCIAHITASINLNNSNNRMYGYLDALKEANLPMGEELIHYYEFNPKSIASYLKRILKRYPQLDGLFVFNDYVANYSVNMLQKLGKSVPAEISVIGFSDEPIATHMTPQLSTLQQVGEEMGEKAAQKITSILKYHLALENEKTVINPKLVLRETTKAFKSR